MLNQRQIEIIFEMYENPTEYYTADYFSHKIGAARRTIQMDMKAIKEELDNIGFATLQAKRAKGSYLNIDNYDMFSDWMNNLCVQYTSKGISTYPMQRIAKIVYLLLERFRDMPMHELEAELFISRSTLLNDLRCVQKNLAEYNLKLTKENNRLNVLGSEIDKRRCLADNSLFLAHLQGLGKHGDNCIDMQRLSYLKNVLLDSFIENQYYISATDFNNAVLNLNIILHRVTKSFFIKQADLTISDNIDRELNIANKIFDKLKLRFLCNIPVEEIRFFAVYLKGAEAFKNHAVINEEMDQFLLDAFAKIKREYGIDFMSNTGLHLSMALHCIPLIIRIKYNMQVKGRSLEAIKQNFPLGYEIAQYFAFLIKERYVPKAKISDDEIALIAAHFYGSLLELRQKSKKNRILVISDLKASMTILLRSVLMKWFSQEISSMEFIQANDMNGDLLDQYDVFLTTEKNTFYENGLAMYVGQFPSDNDRKNIKLLLDGFSNLDDVIQIFQKDLFFSLEHGTKQDILEILSEAAASEYEISGLHEAVMERENIGSTLFGKSIAIPHPIHAISSDTFIAACVIKEPVLWDDEGNMVQVVMMIHIGKNNPRSFQLWDYFSSIFEDKELVKELVEFPTFENFTSKISSLLVTRF